MRENARCGQCGCHPSVYGCEVRDERLSVCNSTVKQKQCTTCEKEIPAVRLEALPETCVCVRCSVVRPKTAKDIEVSTGVEIHDLVDSTHNEGN